MVLTSFPFIDKYLESVSSLFRFFFSHQLNYNTSQKSKHRQKKPSIMEKMEKYEPLGKKTSRL